ncbi:transposase, partial [Yersinia pestis subsp. microtus bv. Talassica]
MWSFVGNKKQQRWLWYAWEPRLKRIIAHIFGRRSKRHFANYWGCCQVSISSSGVPTTSVLMRCCRMKNTSGASFTRSGLSVSLTWFDTNNQIEYMTEFLFLWCLS